MIRNYFRKLIVLLSFFYKNKNEKNIKKEKIVLTKLNKFYKLNNSSIKKLSTHKIFSKQILELIFKKKLKNFLREGFIQKVFFVHNRFYIIFLLIKVFIYKKKFKFLLKEDNIGNPVRYFLYPQSSGNRIREVFHLIEFEKFIRISLTQIDEVFEFGGGYGNMARIFKKINNRITYTIFDTKEVNLIQFYYLCMLNYKTNWNVIKKNQINLLNKIEQISIKKFKNKLFIANWSLSETPIDVRNKIIKKIYKFDYFLISFQKYFENIDNYYYFKKLANYLDNHHNIIYDLRMIPHMNFFNLNKNHWYLFIKKRTN
jgi:hypothetical protein